MTARARRSRHRDFRIYQAARILVTIATQMQAVAIAWQVYAKTHRAIDLGYVGLAEFFPTFSLALFAGALADRFDRKRIVIVTQPGRRRVRRGALRDDVDGAGRRARDLRGHRRHRGGSRVQRSGRIGARSEPRAAAGLSERGRLVFVVLAGGHDHRPRGGRSDLRRRGRQGRLRIDGGALGDRLRARLARCGRGRAAVEKKSASWETFIAGIRYVRRNRILLGSISLDLFAVLFGGASALLPV